MRGRGRGRGAPREAKPAQNVLMIEWLSLIRDTTDKPKLVLLLENDAPVDKAIEVSNKNPDIGDEDLNPFLEDILLKKITQEELPEVDDLSIVSKIRLLMVAGVLQRVLALHKEKIEHNTSIAQVDQNTTQIVVNNDQTAKATERIAEFNEESMKLKFEPWATQIKKREMQRKSICNEIKSEESIRGVIKGIRDVIRSGRAPHLLHTIPEVTILTDILQCEAIPDKIKVDAYERLITLRNGTTLDHLRIQSNVKTIATAPPHERWQPEDTKDYLATGLLSETGTITSYIVEEETSKKLKGGGLPNYWESPKPIPHQGAGQLPIVTTATGHALQTDELEKALTHMSTQIPRLEQQRGTYRGRDVEITKEATKGEGIIKGEEITDIKVEDSNNNKDIKEDISNSKPIKEEDFKGSSKHTHNKDSKLIKYSARKLLTTHSRQPPIEDGEHAPRHKKLSVGLVGRKDIDPLNVIKTIN